MSFFKEKKRCVWMRYFYPLRNQQVQVSAWLNWFDSKLAVSLRNTAYIYIYMYLQVYLVHTGLSLKCNVCCLNLSQTPCFVFVSEFGKLTLCVLTVQSHTTYSVNVIQITCIYMAAWFHGSFFHFFWCLLNRGFPQQPRTYNPTLA